MQFRITLWRSIAAPTLAASLVVLASCDGGSPTGDPDPAETRAAVAREEEPAPPARPGELETIRDRADAAFAALDTPRSRSESRIGPQPWPEDLPARWPRLEEGRVLADLRRDGDRLLLVDWPGDPGGALERFDAALRAGGYDVETGEGGGAGSLRAIGTATAAELTFFPREKVTRIEILFRQPKAG